MCFHKEFFDNYSDVRSIYRSFKLDFILIEKFNDFTKHRLAEVSHAEFPSSAFFVHKMF